MKKRLLKKVLFLFLPFLVFCFPGITGAETEMGGWEDFKIHGFFLNRNDFSMDGTHQHIACENRLQLEFDYKLFKNIIFHGLYRGIYDAIYDLRDSIHYKGDLREAGLSEESELREFFVDIKLKDLDIRIGKQMVIWGEADGLPLMDLIHAWDYRRWYLTGDFEDMRRPLRMLRVDYSLPWKSMIIEAVYIPEDFRRTLLPPTGAYWAPPPLDPLNEEQWRYVMTNLAEDGAPNDSDLGRFGFKLSGIFGGYDVSLNYLSTILDAPIAQLKPDNFPRVLYMKYPRAQIMGATMNKDYGFLVLRGEAAYYFNYPFNDLRQSNLVTDRDYFKWMLGVDRTYYSGSELYNKFFDSAIMISAQIFDYTVLDYDHNLVRLPYLTQQRKHEYFGTLLLSCDYKQRTILPTIMFVRDFTHNGWWIQPKMEYAPGQSWRFLVGANIMDGTGNELPLGVVQNKTELFVQIKYQF